MSLLWLVVVGLAGLSHGVAESQRNPTNPESQAAPGVFALRRTPAAPLGAGGSASFGSSALLLDTESLTPGHYIVNARIKGNDSMLSLGVISIMDPTAAPDPDTYENSNARGNAYQSSALKTQSQVPLPPGLEPADVAGISLSTTGGNVLLTSGSLPPGLH